MRHCKDCLNTGYEPQACPCKCHIEAPLKNIIKLQRSIIKDQEWIIYQYSNSCDRVMIEREYEKVIKKIKKLESKGN